MPEIRKWDDTRSLDFEERERKREKEEEAKSIRKKLQENEEKMRRAASDSFYLSRDPVWVMRHYDHDR